MSGCTVRLKASRDSTRATIGLALVALLSVNAIGEQRSATALIAVRDAHIAPDGRSVAFARGPISDGRPARANLWRVAFAGGDPQSLSMSETEETHPRWAPNGEVIAFLSRPLAADAPAHIFAIPAAGGSTRQLTSGPETVTTFEWSPDGRQIAYLAGPNSQLRTLSVATAGSQPVASLASVSVAAFSWSPDGSTVAAALAGTDPALVIASIAGTASRRELARGLVSPAQVTWAPHSLVAWLASSPSNPGVRIMTTPPAGAGVRDASIAGLGSPIHLGWTGSNRLSVVYRDGAVTWIDLIDTAGNTRTTAMPQWIAELTSVPSWSADGARYVFVGRTAEHPPEVFAGSLPAPTTRGGAIPPPVRRITFSN